MQNFEVFPQDFLSTYSKIILTELTLVVIYQGSFGRFYKFYGFPLAFFMAIKSLIPASLQLIWTHLMLMGLTLPFWWIGQFLTIYIDEPSISIAAKLLSAYYGFWLFRRMIFGINRKFRSTLQRDSEPTKDLKRVAVIGAGMAGIVSAKELVEKGHYVTVFERESEIGGVWAVCKREGGTAWKKTQTSTSALNSVFSDHYFNIWRPGRDNPGHLSRSEWMEMLQGYVDHYGISEHIHLSTTVLAIDPIQDKPGYNIRFKDVNGGVYEECFDAVTICTGINEKAVFPELENRDLFQGEVLHSENWRDDADRYTNKRVVVVGTGESASDITLELVEAGAEVFVSQRSGTLILPRTWLSLPPDFVENLPTYSGTMWNRWGILLGSIPSMFGWFTPDNVLGMAVLARHWITLLTNQGKGPPLKIGAGWFPSVFGATNVTKSDSLLVALRRFRNSCQLVGPIKSYCEDGVQLDDGAILKADAIIFCTGYTRGIPFTPCKSDKLTEVKRLYKLMHDPEWPNIAFIGFARGQVGALNLSTEMQARWWALLVSGDRKLPSKEEMNREIDSAYYHNKHNAQPTRATMSYAYSLAKYEVGCEPDLFQLFFQSRELWLRVYLSSISGPHFRFHGVGAKPDIAKKTLMQNNVVHGEKYLDQIDIITPLLPSIMLSTPLWDLYKHLPFYAWNTATEQYF